MTRPVCADPEVAVYEDTGPADELPLREPLEETGRARRPRVYWGRSNDRLKPEV